MPLSILGARHWEHGETYTDFVNTTGTPPVTDEVSSVSSDDGTYCKRYVFAQGDDVRVENTSQFTRGSSSTAMLVQFTVKVNTLADHDILAFGILPDGSSGAYGISARFDTNGGGSILRHSTASNFQSSSGTTVATIPLGSFVSGVKNVVTLRVVHHDSTGEVQLKVNETIVVNQTGIDTNHTGTPGTLWGWGFAISTQGSPPAGDGNVRISNVTFAQDGAITDLKPQKYKAYVPDGVTAANDGVIFGGAGSVQAALDEIPQTSADGINLNSAGHAQGVTFPTPSESNIQTVHIMGSVGDSAAGSEQLRCDVGDGVGTSTGTAFGLTASFTGKRISNFVHTPPGAASWDAAKADLTATLTRTV